MTLSRSEILDKAAKVGCVPTTLVYQYLPIDNTGLEWRCSRNGCLIDVIEEHWSDILAAIEGKADERLGHSVSVEYESTCWRVQAFGRKGRSIIGHGSDRLLAKLAAVEGMK